jgi:predicted RNA-binding Zn ribbon-like protein
MLIDRAASMPLTSTEINVRSERPRVDLGQRAALVPANPGADAALGRLLADLVTAEATGALARLKMCAADDCRFVHYDHSRSRTSRWCSTQISAATASRRASTGNATAEPPPSFLMCACCQWM